MANIIKKLNPKMRRVLHTIFKVILVLLGTFILAFGTGIFLVPFNIITGGVSGISILLGKLNILSVDIWSYIICWSLFIIGFFVLGLRFSISTLISTIFYPIFLTILLRTGLGESCLSLLCPKEGIVFRNGNLSVLPSTIEALGTGTLLIIALFGGIFVGVGCGITFIGEGSTGGLDILCFIFKKFFNFSVSVTSFILDALIILVGIIVDIVNEGTSTTFIESLIGIIGAFSCAMAIQYIYNGLESSYVCDVITSKPDEINAYVQKELERTTTYFKVVGGYSKEEKTMIRLVFAKREYTTIKDALGKIDPDAFITFTKAKLVTGEGFQNNENSKDLAIISMLKKRKKK